MMILVAMPVVALVSIIVLCLKAKHQFQTHAVGVEKKIEGQRQDRLRQDDENDNTLIQSVVSGKKALASALSHYAEVRKRIFPEFKRQDPQNWTNDDLINYLKRLQFSLMSQFSHKLLLRTSYRVISVVAVGLAVAAWRYHSLSNHADSLAPTQNAQTVPDPFASFTPPTK